MFALLLACAPEPLVEDPADASDKPADHVAADQPFDTKALRPVPLPEAPFTARTRLAPTTLVDKHGTPVLVLDAVGVEVQVARSLTDRVWVTCTGCRAPVEAWVLRQGVFLGDEDRGGPDDALLAWLDGQELPQVAANGFVQADDLWVAPPWHDEGGYAGPVLRLKPAADGFEVTE